MQKWTEETISEAILKVSDLIGEERMPTNKECVKYTNSNALSCKISKTGGFSHWADKLGLKSKMSCSVKGWKYEQVCVDFIKDLTGVEAQLTPVKSPYDVKFKNVRIDVKMSNKIYSKTQRFYSYTFNINDSNCGSDFYVFYCVDGEDIKKTYVVPCQVLKNKKQFCIGIGATKYDKYLNRWDLVINYNDIITEWIKYIE